jgi:hypothetical protein
MSFDLTKKTIVWVGILSVLALGIILGVVVPTLGYIKKTSEDSFKLRMLLEDKYEQSLRSHITRRKLEEIKISSADFYPFLFRAGDDLKLITFLENLSTKHNISQTITNSTLDKINTSHIVSVSMNINGNYTDILKYIADLEASDYFIYINEMQFTPSFSRNSEPVQNLANLSFTIELYVNQ